MVCNNCKSSIEENARFCRACGTSVLRRSTDMRVATEASSGAVNSKVFIRCGNCSYEGSGESARSVTAQILAWLCVLVAPVVTIIYFVAAPKYRCPQCKSTFLGIKNDQGVFVGQNSGRRVAVAIACILGGVFLVGLLATLVVTWLGSAKIKAYDAHRLTDLKQLQTALELYKAENRSYPVGTDIILGSPEHACLNADGWQIVNCPNPYLAIVPHDPHNGGYVYSSDSKSYVIATALEGGVYGYVAGPIGMSPDGLSQFKFGTGYLGE